MTSQQLGNIEEYIEVNNKLLDSYRDLVKILYSKINDLEALLDLTEKAKKCYKELYLRDNAELREEFEEEIKELQSEIDALRKDDSHIKA